MHAPNTIIYSTTTTGCRRAVAQYPVAQAMHARHLPSFQHEGITYAPYTGTVIDTADRVERYGQARGFYMEYRALRTMPLQP